MKAPLRAFSGYQPRNNEPLTREIFLVRIRAPLRSDGMGILRGRNALVFPASNAEIAHAETTLAQAKFSGVASQFFVPNFRACRPGTTWCPRVSRVFYCQPFKGKPGASRGRKASGL
jgi:hypothetical protein